MARRRRAEKVRLIGRPKVRERPIYVPMRFTCHVSFWDDVRRPGIRFL
jgi:hypothetical protein